ncbi:MAG: ATP-binding protein [Pseudanabaena sp. ELA748]
MLIDVLQTYPQPIAYAYGNIHRARSEPERLDQIMRCAEVTTRYLAAMAIASFAARTDSSLAIPEAFTKFQGNLSFGHFLSIVQAISGLRSTHPLVPQFSQSFQAKKSTAKGKLEELIELRNRIGHDLKGLSEASVKQIIVTDRPLEKLEELLAGINPLCSLPLFLVDTQKPIKKVNHIQRLLLMGESGEPMPQSIGVSDYFMYDKRLFIGTHDGALALHPMLVWGMERDRAAQSIYLIHKVNPNSLEYRSLAAENQPTEPPLTEDLLRLIQGELVPIESIALQDGRSFLEEWQDLQSQIRQGMVTRSIDWTALDAETLRWYSNVLKARDKEKFANNISAEEVIRTVLLDGRGELPPEEWLQMFRLFGKQPEMRKVIGRDVLDLRLRQSADERFSDRQEISDNLLTAISKAVDFIGKYNPELPTMANDGLQTPTGSTDYIAVREALVNLFIHQDYSDLSTVAQIELEPDRTKMVNAGSSLVSDEDLINGGTSTARNPLVARALKLIGFAELAGSGLREVRRVWRMANRRPPKIISDEQRNRFSIELDSRPMEIVVDDLWLNRLGVKISPDEAKLLGILSNFPQGMALSEVCSSTGQLSDEAVASCQRLLQQALIDMVEDKYCLKPHFLELARESAR